MVGDALRQIFLNFWECRTAQYRSTPRHALFNGPKQQKSIFNHLKERLWQRAHSWKGKFLSIVGREVLIEVVFHSIPTFYISAMLLPTSLLDELQKILNSFWCGQIHDRKRRIHWLTWSKLVVPKKIDGMGFRDLICLIWLC